MNEFGLVKESENPLQYCRHPFVYLLEAADDIAYRIIDFEDAARLGIISIDLMLEKVIKLLTELNRDNISEVEETLNMIGDQNEKLS